MLKLKVTVLGSQTQHPQPSSTLELLHLQRFLPCIQLFIQQTFVVEPLTAHPDCFHKHELDLAPSFRISFLGERRSES